MPSLLPDDFRISNARDFKNLFATNSIYAVISKTTPWIDPNDPTVSDNAPPFPLASVQNQNFVVWRDALAGKKIPATDVSLVFPKYEWTSGTRYDSYSDTSELNFAPLTKFIVVTDELKVYKCIERPLTGVSTVKPTTTSPTVTAFSPVDRYRWKYLFSIPTQKAVKFINSQFAPVADLATNPADGGLLDLQWAVQQAAVSGGILSAEMRNEGTGYTTASVSIAGDGVGATATATVQGGSVKYITITNPGTGYTRATVMISGDGVGAAAVALVPPPGGHGKSPERDVGAFYSMSYIRFDRAESGVFPTDNDFRQIFLVRNPSLTAGGPATGPLYSQTYALTLNSIVGTISQDNTFTTSTGSGVVASINGSTIRVTSVSGIINPGMITFNSATAVIASVAQPEMALYSGNIIVIENRKPISRSPDQSEEFRQTIQF